MLICLARLVTRHSAQNAPLDSVVVEFSSVKRRPLLNTSTLPVDRLSTGNRVPFRLTATGLGAVVLADRSRTGTSFGGCLVETV